MSDDEIPTANRSGKPASASDHKWYFDAEDEHPMGEEPKTVNSELEPPNEPTPTNKNIEGDASTARNTVSHKSSARFYSLHTVLQSQPRAAAINNIYVNLWGNKFLTGRLQPDVAALFDKSGSQTAQKTAGARRPQKKPKPNPKPSDKALGKRKADLSIGGLKAESSQPQGKRLKLQGGRAYLKTPSQQQR
jgi:hypothetical protein